MTIDDRNTRRGHIDKVVRNVVRPAIYPGAARLDVAVHHLHGEPIPGADAMARDFEPFAVGQSWGGRWDTSWFRFRGTVPDAWAGEEVVALVDTGGIGGAPSFTAESLVWENGAPAHGLHVRHKEHPIAAAASGGEVVEFFVEAAANPLPPFQSSEWPLLEPDLSGTPIYVLTRADLVVVDREVEALYFDARALMQLIDAIPDEPRNSQVFRALVEATNAVDPADVRGTAKAARAALADVLAAPATSGHRVTAVGHAHIDSAWLWPVRETRRKCVRTFANQLQLLERYPEHRFSCSQAQQYAWVRDDAPTVFAGIEQAVAEGRWEPVGGMWVEPDTNVPSGESLVRQVVHGKRFFLDAFGVESAELWIPDVFGYSAALPQIAQQAGVTALITQKLSWNSVNRFPHSTFWWEGHDGTRLLTHFPPAETYNGSWTVQELHGSVATFADHGRSDRSLYPFGYGDGGGGPSREMLEYARRLGDLDGLPRVEIGTVGAFLDAVRTESSDLDTWVGELYLEFHRGTYTTHADVKTGNRRGEEALRAAELWSVAARGLVAYPAAELDRAWKLLLLNQFHDIIPGSSINWVYEDARRDYADIASVTNHIIETAQAALGGGVFNAASHDRREVIDLDGALAMVEAPACGWAPLVALDAADTVTASDGVLENGELRVTWDGDGLLTSVWDKTAGREVLATGGQGNVFQLHADNPNEFDAWDIDITYLDKVTDLIDLESVEIVERDPLRAGVRFVRRFGASTITQTMRLAAGSRRLEFVTEVDWQERHQLLKVAFPVAVRSTRATYEIQHGHIERPTVWNTTWDAARFEVCGHRWADLSEPGYGVALLNDCKYGYDIHGNVMRLTLLRGPGFPDPEADRGVHHFAYALLPHAGDLRDAGVIEQAEAFNLPLVVRPGAVAPRQVVRVPAGVSVEAVKQADCEDAIVVRLCEVWGGRRSVAVEVGFDATSVTRTDLLERDTEPLVLDGRTVTLDLRPFELVTLKFAV